AADSYTQQWNPTRFSIYGSNRPLTWEDDQWSLVGEGSTGLNGSTVANSWGGDVSLASGASYVYYKIVFNQTVGGFQTPTNYFAQVAEIRLSSSAGQIAAMPATSGTPTVVTHNGPAFSVTPDFAGTDFTVTLDVGAGGSIDVGREGNADRLAGLGLTVTGDLGQSVSLRGSLEALQNYLSIPGVVRYQVGSARDLTMTLTSAAVSKVSSNTSPSPATAAALSYTISPIRIGPIAGEGTLNVTLAVSGGVLTSSAGNGTAAGVTTSGSGSTSITLSGKAETINAYLASSSRFSISASPGDYALTVTASGADGSSVRRSTLTVGSPASTQGMAAVSSAPSLSLPANFVAAVSNGEIRLAANALGSGSAARTLVLSVSGGTLVTALGNGLSEGVTASGSGSGTLTLSGSEASLSAYVATAGRILFNGTAGSYTLTATAQGLSGSVVQSAQSATATLEAVGASQGDFGPSQPAVPVLRLAAPATYTIQTSGGALNLGASAVALAGATDKVVSLVLSAGSGTSLAASAGDGTLDGVTASGSGSSVLTLSGNAQALASYLAANGRIRFTGSAGSTTLNLSASATGASNAQVSMVLTVVAPPVFEPVGGPLSAPRVVSLPKQIPVTTQVLSPLGFAGANLGGGTTALSLNLSVPQGVLAATSGAGVTVQSGGAANSLTLSGTGLALEAFLQAGSVRYTGAGGALTLTVTAPDGSNASANVTLEAVVQDAAVRAGARLASPLSINVLAGTITAVPFAPDALSGPAEISFSVTGSTRLHWAASDSLRVSMDQQAATLPVSASEGATSVTMAGDAATLSAYLARSGLKISAGSNTSISVSVNANGVATTQTISVVLASAAARARVGPQLSVPSVVNVASADGRILLGAQEGITGVTASDTLTLTVSVDDAVAISEGAQGLARVDTDGNLVDSPARSLRITATAAELNALLRAVATGAAAAIRYVGPSGVTLRFAVSEAGAAASADSASMTVGATSRVNRV
ncbi:MAG: hypothetical protein EB027_04205, partial [Actinobacteria bacterium]|nr:hypothetical protein [Actinomycetota bacterium]